MNPSESFHRSIRAASWSLAALAILGPGPASGQDKPTIPIPADAERIPIATERAPYDPDLARKNVAAWAENARRDPQGAIALRELAGAYLALQRETGDIADAVRAEAAARRSLEILRRGNTNAAIRLARALLAQHRFPEALAIAEKAAETDPNAVRLVVDIRLELGDYDAAAKALDAIPTDPDDLNLKALRARFEAINGHPDRSLALMEEARKVTEGRPDMPAEAAAWYHTMVGHALIDSGRLEDGELACRKALEVFPRDYRAMTGMAEAATWRGDHAGASAWASKALAISAQNPEALRLLGEAYAAMNKPREAEEQSRALRDLARSFPRIYDRHWAVFLADEGKDLDEALALAREDLQLRRDIGAHETLAWACFRKGLVDEAAREIALAMARGTQEAGLFRHAAMIAEAQGDRTRADSLLARARALNPYLVKPAPGR